MNKVRLLMNIAASAVFFCNFSHAFTLQETIRHALQTNPEVLASLNEYEARKFEVKQARADYLPTIQIDAGIGKEERRAASTGDQKIDLDRTELGVTASQLVFDGFAARNEVERQNARLETSSHEIKVISEDIALSTSSAYLEVLKQNELLTLTQGTLQEHQNIYEQMKLRSDRGVGSRADLDQIGARLALANTNVLVAKNNFADAKVAFYRLTGMYPKLEAMAKPSLGAKLPDSLQDAIDLAVSNHPTLASAGADIRATRAQYEAAGSQHWPVFRLEAEKRWDENVGVPGDDEDLIVALRMTYDLYRGGANKARRKQTAYQIEEAKDIRNNARRQVVESMNLSWNAYDALKAQRTFLDAHVRAAESAREAYGKQFNIGRRTLLDLLNTETEVVEAKRALINAEHDTIYSAYRILHSAGELTKALGV